MKRLERRYKSHDNRFDSLLDSFMYYFSQMEIKDSCENAAIVDELDRSIRVIRNLYPPEYHPRLFSPMNVSARYPENWLNTEAMKRHWYRYLSNSPDTISLSKLDSELEY